MPTEFNCHLALLLLLLFLLLLLVPSRSPFSSATKVWTKFARCYRDSRTGGCNGTAVYYQCHKRNEKISDKDLFDHCYEPYDVRREDCEIASVKGLCRPSWTKWSEWSECPRTCGHHQQSRRRHCQGVGEEDTIGWSESCRDPKHIQVEMYRGNPFGVDAKKCASNRRAQLCPKVNGGWGPWGTFSQCLSKCGTCYKIARRNCTQPPPSGGGLPCLGYNSKRQHCSAPEPCPRDGNWCPWKGFCPAECGSSIITRVRECKCPSVLYGGKPCAGDRESVGECPSKKSCPSDTRLNEQERQLLRDNLRSNSPELIFAHTGNGPPMLMSDLVLACPADRPVRKSLFDREQRFPRKRYEWVKDGKVLNMTDRIRYDTEHLVVFNLTVADVGFYQLMVIRDIGKRPVTICFYPIPMANEIVYVNKGDSLNLTCPLPQLKNLTATMMGAWKTYWSFVPSPRSQLAGSRREHQMWLSNTLVMPLSQSGTAQMSRMSILTEGAYSCYAQLMSIRVNGSEMSVDPIPPSDEDEPNLIKSIASQHDRLSIGSLELTDPYLIGHTIVVLRTQKSIKGMVIDLVSKNKKFFALLAFTAFLFPGLSLAAFLKQQLRRMKWQKRQRHLDAEEVQLIKARIVVEEMANQQAAAAAAAEAAAEAAAAAAAAGVEANDEGIIAEISKPRQKDEYVEQIFEKDLTISD